MLKTKIPNIGKIHDENHRQHTHRVDDAHRRFDVNRAREYIYTDGKTVKSVFVTNLLDPQSLVPTKVCLDLFLVTSCG